jgi:hypothetical protein
MGLCAHRAVVVPSITYTALRSAAKYSRSSAGSYAADGITSSGPSAALLPPSAGTLPLPSQAMSPAAARGRVLPFAMGYGPSDGVFGPARQDPPLPPLPPCRGLSCTAMPVGIELGAVKPLRSVSDIAVDPRTGTVYISDPAACCIVKIAPDHDHDHDLSDEQAS